MLAGESATALSIFDENGSPDVFTSTLRPPIASREVSPASTMPKSRSILPCKYAVELILILVGGLASSSPAAETLGNQQRNPLRSALPRVSGASSVVPHAVQSGPIQRFDNAYDPIIAVGDPEASPSRRVPLPDDNVGENGTCVGGVGPGATIRTR
jgi:hypothetical protein